MDQLPAIELRGLVRRFGERAVLRDVSVALPAGATLAVLGRNGAGKSTLLRILATLLRPHGGEVCVLGEALPRRAFAVRGRLGLLAHDPLLSDATHAALLRFAHTALGDADEQWKKKQYPALVENALRQLIAVSPDVQTS